MQFMLQQLAPLGLVVLLCSSVSSMATGKEGRTVSKATLEQLKLIEDSIDHSVEPCDDFYSYACANWENLDYGSSNHQLLEYNYLKAVKNMFVTKYPAKENVRKQNQSFTDKVLAFYHSCESDDIDLDGLDYFKELKPGKDIEWPLLDSFNGKPETNMENFDLFTFLGDLFSHGINNFLLQFAVNRESNGSLSIILATAYEDKHSITSAPYMLKRLGIDNFNEREQFLKQMDGIKETHEKWLVTYDEYSEENSGCFSYQQIKQLYPQLAKFLDLILPNQLKDNDVVTIDQLDFIEFLIKKQWQPEEQRKLCNYAMSQVYRYVEHNSFGVCTKLVRSQMHFAVNYMYRQHYYNAEGRATFNDLQEKIRKQFLQLVDENHLQFNDGQLKAIRDKLARIYVSVGNVPDYADVGMVEEFYGNMPDMDIDNYWKNLLLSLKQRFWERLNCPKNMECIGNIGHGVYNVVENDLVIVSLASMKPAMYDYTFDPILAVSLMGTFIGHECGHSIDFRSLMDSELYPSMYEEFQSDRNLNASLECTIQQQPNVYPRQLEVDLAGARAAFRVYNTEYKIQPSFTKIPWQQLFFLNFAQFFCEQKPRSTEVSDNVKRTNHVAMNMEEFAKAFECPAGSKMNPVEKCLYF